MSTKIPRNRLPFTTTPLFTSVDADVQKKEYVKFLFTIDILVIEIQDEDGLCGL